MGILSLSRLIADVCPEAIREVELKSLFGRRVAVDASMCIYQFLIAIRNKDQLLTNDSGETTSHLIGLFYRTIKLLEMGIKPIYVFDGKAPELKCGELSKRADRRKEAESKLADAVEQQDMDNINKFNKRVVRVTRQHNNDCKKLLRLMGLPVIESPSEAEAQCAQLCKENLVYATATEDMDALTFGSPRLIRNLTSGNNEKVKEYSLDKVLEGLQLTHNQFIDLGILMGCDYCDSIKGIGGKKGLELMKSLGSIEQILEQKCGITEFIDVDIDYGDRKEVVEMDDSVKQEENGKQEVNGNDVENGLQKDVKSEDNKEEVNGNEVEKTNFEESEDKPTEQKLELTQENEEELDSDKEVEESDKEVDESDKEVEESDKEVEDSDKDVDESHIEDESLSKSKKISKKKDKKKSKEKKGLKVPENWLFIGARKLFIEPNVLKGTVIEADLKQKDPDDDAIVQFLCVENGFSEDRVRNALKRIKESKGKCSQTRIDSFFKMMPNTNVKTKTDQKSDSNSKNKRSGAQTKSASKRGRR